MRKYLISFTWILCFYTTNLYALTEENILALSTNSYNIQIIYDCKAEVEECIDVRYKIYEKQTKKTIQARGKAEESKRLLDDGTFSGPKLLGYNIILESETWYIGIPFGRLTKYDKNGKETFSELGEWEN